MTGLERLPKTDVHVIRVGAFEHDFERARAIAQGHGYIDGFAREGEALHEFIVTPARHFVPGSFKTRRIEDCVVVEGTLRCNE